MDQAITRLRNFIYQSTAQLCYVCFLWNHLVNGNLLSAVYPLATFCYALIQQPYPTVVSFHSPSFALFKKLTAQRDFGIP